MNLPAESTLIAGKYRLVRLLGRGGMGAVYEARHEVTRKRCAVKLLRGEELAGDAESTKRFFREARAAGSIECAHVVSALDSGVDEAGRAYYVMEYLAGEDLSQLLERVVQLTPAAAAKIALQAARGLESAHRLGIVHRDIKPGNLFLTSAPSGEVTVKVLDFGVAKVKMEVFEESGGSPTQSGALLGTLQYMSPGQLKRASEIDETADLWSLGILLYECITGELPWSDADGLGELVTSILTQPVPPLRDRAPWASAELARVVLRATARDDSRYGSARELRAALEELPEAAGLLRAEELVAPSDQEKALWRDRVEAELRSRRTVAPVVSTVRTGSKARVALYVASAAAAVLGTWSLATQPVSVADRAVAAPAEVPAWRPASLPALASTTDDRRRELTNLTRQDAPADMADQPDAVPSARSGDRRRSSTALRRTEPSVSGAVASASPVRVPSASLPAGGAAPPIAEAEGEAAAEAQTPLERMGGNVQWPHAPAGAAP